MYNPEIVSDSTLPDNRELLGFAFAFWLIVSPLLVDRFVHMKRSSTFPTDITHLASQ